MLKKKIMSEVNFCIVLSKKKVHDAGFIIYMCNKRNNNNILYLLIDKKKLLYINLFAEWILYSYITNIIIIINKSEAHLIVNIQKGEFNVYTFTMYCRHCN